MSSTQGGMLFADDGALYISDSAPSNIRKHQFNTDQTGLAYVDLTNSPAATDPRWGGLAFTNTGSLYCSTDAVGATSVVQGGIARSATGVMHVRFSKSAANFTNGGLNTSGTGAVYVSYLPSFEVIFRDAGAGVVTTTAAFGGVTATFTRATTATTVLSTLSDRDWETNLHW